MSPRSKSNQLRVRYLFGAAMVWGAIWIATAVVLEGTDGFAVMIPILLIGTAWFVAVVPAQLATSQRADSADDGSADAP